LSVETHVQLRIGKTGDQQCSNSSVRRRAGSRGGGRETIPRLSRIRQATAVGESKTLQFRMDAPPNILNHPELNSPTLNITNASFGTINGKTTLRRQFQAQVRLTF
jgi:hypothetical protein